MTATHGPARQLVAQADENAVACAAWEISDVRYTATWFELCAAADAHDAAFAALVEAAEAALQWLSAEVWTWEGAMEWGEQLRAAIDAAKGER